MTRPGAVRHFTLPGPSVANTGYYQGNDYTQSVESVDGFTLNYGVKADNAAFEKVMRALDLIRTDPNDTDTRVEALRVLEIGMDEMAILQASTSQRPNT